MPSRLSNEDNCPHYPPPDSVSILALCAVQLQLFARHGTSPSLVTYMFAAINILSVGSWTLGHRATPTSAQPSNGGGTKDSLLRMPCNSGYILPQLTLASLEQEAIHLVQRPHRALSGRHKASQ